MIGILSATRSSMGVVTLSLVAAFIAPSSPAATSNWKGTSNTTWSNSANWTGSIPGSSDAASFGTNFTGSNQPNITSSTTIGEIIASSSLGKNVTLTTGSNTLTLAGISGTAIDYQASAYSMSIAGNISLQGTQTIAVADGSANVDLDISANVIDMWYTSITKTGAGTLRLSGNNTFQGTFTISGGTVIAANSNALGSSTWNNVVANGAALHLTGGITLNEGSFEIAGTGPDGLGAIRSLSGSNTYNGVIKTTAAATIGVNSGAGLTIGGSGVNSDINYALTIQNSGTFAIGSGNNLNLNADLTFNGNGNSTISSNQISGVGIITKNGSGTLTFNGSGTFSPSALNVREGTVELNRTFNPGNQSGLTIGTTSGPAATLKLLSSDKLRDDLKATVYESGTFDLNGKNEGIAALTLYGGTVNTNGGTLTLANAGGDVVTSKASTQVATINGNVQLAQDNLQAVTFTVEDSALETELVINGAISQKDSGSKQTLLVKSGAGTMEFTGTTANTYKGVTRIDGGTLKLNKSDGVDAIAGNSIQINSGGTLLLDSNNQIANATTLTLNGGTFNTGSGSGYNEKLGTLTLSSSSTIDLGSGLHLLEFADSHSQTWNGTLTIYDWVGPAGGPGTEGRIFVGTNTSGLTASQLAQVTFDGFAPGAILLSNGELVPLAAIPEAKTVIAASVLLLAIGWKERKRLSAIAKTFRRRTA